MPEAAPSLQVLRFGAFELDLRAGELRKQGLKIKLQEKPLQILALLLDNPGQAVTREELRQQLWTVDTFVDFDHGVNTAINKLREALGDSAENPRFIETLPRHGYRFIAEVDSGAGVRDRRQGRRWLIGLTGVAGTVILLFAYWVMAPQRPPRVLSSTQLTYDGVMKFPPVLTDGSRVYFTGPAGVYEVSVAGGEPARLATPNRVFYSPSKLAAISADGSELLFQSYEGNIHYGPLWAVPTVSGTARRVSGVTSADAAWLPDGQRIVYASGHALYVVRIDGTASRRLVTVNGTPSWMRWSPDGHLLRFTVTDPKTNVQRLWEVGAEGSGLHPLLPGWNNTAGECCGTWTADGKYFVFQSMRNFRSDIWAIREKPGIFRKPKPTPVQLTRGPLSFEGPQPGKNGRKIFAVGTQRRGELLRYDIRSKQFVTYLQGISVDGVDFSRDGQWITYVAVPEGTLWRSKLDGSERLQLSFPPMMAFMPRWSPDGMRIAFVGISPGRPYTAYILSADGGKLEEIVPRLGDPGWLADGNSVVLGTDPAEHKFSESFKGTIQIMDLKSRQVSTMPGSEGLYDPLPSPDGHYVAALRAGPETLWVFDFSKSKWFELDKIPVDFWKWSSDSKYIYFNSFENEPWLCRLRVADAHLDRLASLKGIRQTGVFGWPWSGVTPDGSPLVLRDIGTSEIYSVDVDLP
ncbi:MAG TPA: winged helix-turn-helix domain-containing protein [Terriglobia bacterium]|nr:winged helix-turn-helix domain-containing protein [Terriglobia bacterium]